MTAIPADEPLAANDPNPAYEAALASALEMTRDAQVFDLARAAANPDRRDLVAALMAHELAGCHRMMMRFTAEAQRRFDSDALGFAAMATRLMDRYRLAALALDKLRPAEPQIRKIIVDWGADDGNPHMNGGGTNTGGGSANDTGSSAPSAGGGGPGPQAARGRLKNGNPSGDFLAAPRCGAKTRAGAACRQPAMANGRCRLHGGKSTGARTAEGLNKVRSVNLRHGNRTAEVIGLRSAASAVGKRLAWMTRLSRELSAGHGVVRSESTKPLDSVAPLVGATCGRPSSAQTPPAPSRFRKEGERSSPLQRTDRACAAAGHGVVRSESTPPLGRPAVTPHSAPAAARSSPPAHSRSA